MLYYGQNGRTYELDRVIKSGGEGIVHSIQGNPYSVAKIYKPERIADPQLLESTRDKILAMLAMRFNPRVRGRVVVAWPEDALFDRRGVFQGFVMPKIQDMKSLIWASRPSDRDILWPNGYRWRYSLAIAFNLAWTIECLHSAGIVVGDMNTNNILINAKGMVTLIDADSFNIQPYKCIVGFPEVLPPELQGKDLRKPVNTFSEKTDCFSLAIHIFSVLCNNCHPFGCLDYNKAHGSSSTPQIQGNILKGYCPYVSASRGRTVDDALDMDVFPSDLRYLFDRVFHYDSGTAVKRSTIANRPSAAEWRNALGNLYDDLYQSGGGATCRFNPLHEYPKYYKKGCPWCAIEQRKRHIASLPLPSDSNSPPRRTSHPKSRSHGIGLWASYDNFISGIGHWFRDKSVPISVTISMVFIAIVAVWFGVDVIRTWLAGQHFSAIIYGGIVGALAYHGYLIATVILSMCIQAIFFVFRLIFKNAAWFTSVVIISTGIYYVATHEEILASIIEFAQSFGIYPKTQFR